MIQTPSYNFMRNHHQENFMVMAKCRECGTEVSDAAKVCPKCGISNPVKNTSLLVKLFLVLIGFMILSELIATGSTDSSSKKLSATGAQHNRQTPNSYDACISRGIAYFKEIGSYPVLLSPPNAGRSAEEVARERCGRTRTAF